MTGRATQSQLELCVKIVTILGLALRTSMESWTVTDANKFIGDHLSAYNFSLCG